MRRIWWSLAELVLLVLGVVLTFFVAWNLGLI